MNYEIKSTLREKYAGINCNYEIININISHLTYIKKLTKEITNHKTKGYGHIIKHVVWADENGVLFYSVIPQNELGSSISGTVKSINEFNDDDHLFCRNMFEEFQLLALDNNFSSEAINVYKEFCKKFKEQSLIKINKSF